MGSESPCPREVRGVLSRDGILFSSNFHFAELGTFFLTPEFFAIHRCSRSASQPSLRDLDCPSRNPTLESVGYSQISHPGDLSPLVPERDPKMVQISHPVAPSLPLPEGDPRIAQQFTAGFDWR